MDIERSLLSKVILTGDLTPLSDAKITRHHFRDLGHQAVYDSIIRHRTDYGQTPSLAVIKLDHPSYRVLTEVAEPLAWLIDEIRAARSQVILEQGMAEAILAEQNGSVLQMRAALARALAQEAQEIPHGKDLDLTQTSAAFWDYYLELKKLDGRLRGIPTGFHTLDNATQGWQPGNLIVFTGVQKSGKSTLMLNSAMACHRHGKTPAFFGFEMTNLEQQERHAAFWAGISFERLRSGQLTTPEEKQLARALRQLEDMPSFYLSNDDMGTATVTGLASKVERLRPDVVYLDGVYMMDDEHGEQRMSDAALRNIVQGLKQAAMHLSVPIVCTTQSLNSKLGRGGKVTAASVGYTSAFGQYCDAMVSVEQTEDNTIQRIAAILGRNFRNFEAFIEWDWERGRFAELDGNPFLAEDHDHAPASGF